MKPKIEENAKFVSLFESVKDKYDFLSDADNALDGKAGTLMGFEITFGIAYISFVINDLEGIKFYEGVIGLALLGISIIALLVVNWPKKYMTISVNPFERKEYLRKSERDLLLQLISDAQNAFTVNNKIVRGKARLYKLAITLLVMSSIFFTLSKIGEICV